MNSNNNINPFVYPFTYTIYCFGFDIFIPNRKTTCVKVIKYAIKIIKYVAIIFFIYNHKYKNITRNDIFDAISSGIKLIIIAISFLYFEINCTRINCLINKINKSLTIHEQKRSQFISKLLIIIWIVICLINTLLNELSIIVSPARSFIIDIIDGFLWSLFINGWIIAINLLLINICYAVYLIEKRLLINDSNAYNYEVLKQKLCIIERHKEAINKTLGIFPFLWFCEFFSTTCL